jgi:hypothetical protein
MKELEERGRGGGRRGREKREGERKRGRGGVMKGRE